MKHSLKTGFRAFAFALGAFVLIALSGIKVRSSTDVALFILGLAAFWVVIERVFMNIKQQKKDPQKKPGPP
jgi:hypothetical protein